MGDVMFKVELIERDDGWSYYQGLQITHRGEVVGNYRTDRDYHLLKAAIEEVYKLGVKDGLGIYNV